MAIKGLGYRKTSWSFEERPVASTKLNTWDDRIEAAVELALFVLTRAWGQTDGVLRGATAGDLAVSAQSPAGLTVQVAPGYALIDGAPYVLGAAVDTVAIAPPSAEDRIDLVQASLAERTVTVKSGTEAAAPNAPTPDADRLALAQLYLRPGMTAVKNTDDSTNGYIIDVRPFL